ncbi:hypothetical protein [Streptomyces sp. NPDC046942]|uniref:family 4 glycosyl hydrolase n=1 Tax=Streptomyces sp. NPDC046942 TaxID=3155137 RepID=UPI0033D5C792
MKSTVLGGGFRVPYVHQAPLSDQGAPRIDDVRLYDTDPARLNAMAEVLARFADGRPGAPTATATTALDDAPEGSDFVFGAVRVGGLAGRTCLNHLGWMRRVLHNGEAPRMPWWKSRSPSMPMMRTRSPSPGPSCIRPG